MISNKTQDTKNFLGNLDVFVECSDSIYEVVY